MKLNQTELGILAKRICLQIKDQDVQTRKKALEAMDDANMNQAEIILDEYKGLSARARRIAFGNKYGTKTIDTPSLDTILKKLRNTDKLPAHIHTYDTYDLVKDELILANSSKTDRDSLMTLVKGRFGLL